MNGFTCRQLPQAPCQTEQTHQSFMAVHAAFGGHCPGQKLSTDRHSMSCFWLSLCTWCPYIMTDLLHAGPAAQQQRGVKALEQLAAEIEAGSNTAMRIVWKWACYQVRLCTTFSKVSILCACTKQCNKQWGAHEYSMLVLINVLLSDN